MSQLLDHPRTADAHLDVVSSGRMSREEPGHLPALDGVRGLAILMVMLTHFTLIEKGPKIDLIFGAITRFGWSGVDLFFVLSGFLITGILYDSKGGERYFRTFYARRTLRIFPLYYAVVFFSLVILPLLGSFGALFGYIGKTWPLYWVYLSNFPIAFTDDKHHDVLSLTWSLAIEEQFYLIWPLVVLFCRRETLMKVCAVIVACAILVRTSMVMFGPPDWIPFGIAFVSFSRMDALAIGALIALVVRGPGSIRSLIPIARILLPLCLLGLAAITAYHRTMHWRGGPGQCAGYTVLALMFGSVLVIALHDPGTGIASRFFTGRWLMTLGKYSYALYLLHFPAHVIIKTYVYGPEQFVRIGNSRLPGQIIFIALSFGLSMVLALLSWNLLEKRFLALKRYFPTTRARGESSGPSLRAVLSELGDESNPGANRSLTIDQTERQTQLNSV